MRLRWARAMAVRDNLVVSNFVNEQLYKNPSNLEGSSNFVKSFYNFKYASCCT